MITSFGERIRELRAQKGVTMQQMAQSLGVSSAYLSALESGRRGAPSLRLIHLICQYFDIIWDEAEALTELARFSNPKVKINCAGLSTQHSLFVHCLAQSIDKIPNEMLERWLKEIEDLE